MVVGWSAMRQKVKDRLIGVWYVALFPLILIVAPIVFWFQSALYAVVFLIILAFIYFAWLSSEVTYGPQQIRQVEIPGAPEAFEELLKTTTTQGDLINVYLIEALEDKKKLSQTYLVACTRDRHNVKLTHQSIRDPYILKLEELGVIHSPATSRDKEYTLTPRGMWCLRAIKVCFPRSHFYFIFRHYLGIRRLLEFPEEEPKPK